MEDVGFFTPQTNPAGSFNLQYNHGHFLFINESYSNLRIKLDSGKSFRLQSGQCRMVCINQASTNITYSTISTLQLANAVDEVAVEYYPPGEKYLEQYPSNLSRQSIIGNTVTTSAVSTTLFNQATATQIDVIKIGTVANPLDLNIKNDGSCVWFVEQGGVQHQVIKIQTAGKPLLLGNGTDNIEVLLNLDVDGNLYVAGHTTLDNGNITTDGAGNVTLVSIAMPNNQSVQMKDNGATLRAVLFVDTNGDTHLQQAGNNRVVRFSDNTGATFAYFDPANVYNAGQLYDKSGNRVCGTSQFNGSGTGTYSHGYLGHTPSAVYIEPNFVGSATTGVDSIGSTTVHVTLGSGSGFLGLAVHT